MTTTTPNPCRVYGHKLRLVARDSDGRGVRACSRCTYIDRPGPATPLRPGTLHTLEAPR
jgi:phage/plasmid primase-like uncharacterized protein